MANASFSLSHGVESDTAASSDVTEGTSAPGAGDIEVRINASNLNQKQVYVALMQIWRFLADPGFSTSVPPAN